MADPSPRVRLALATFRFWTQYFRFETEGFEVLAATEPSLIVGYHGGPWTFDLWMLGARMYGELAGTRYDVPITVITCEFPSAMLRELMAKGHSYTAELAKVHDAKLVDLPTGHWPQFTKPAQLGAAIVEALT